MEVVVNLTLATICYLGQCHPALVGNDTRPGTYAVQKRLVRQPGYGGDVLSYRETPTEIYAIHRVYTLKPKQRREYRLYHGTVAERQNVTGGCINIDPIVYDNLAKNWNNIKLVIRY